MAGDLYLADTTVYVLQGRYPRVRRRFDGRSWSVRADYRRAGHRLPPPEAPPEASPVRTVTMDVAVRHPGTLGWLPSPGRGQQLSVEGLGVDERTGDIVIPDDQPPPARAGGGRPHPPEPGAPDPRSSRPPSAALPSLTPESPASSSIRRSTPPQVLRLS